jgi:hypothetical protein
MLSSEDPPLSEYQQTVQDFIALLQALRAWRKVIHLYYQGRMIGRLTVNFAELMKKSSNPKITIVDHFDDDRNMAIWRNASAPPAPVAADPAPTAANRAPPAAAPAPRIIHRAFPPDPAKPIPQPDWAALFERPLDFSYPQGPVRVPLSPEEVTAGLAALAPILAGPLPPIPVWHADFADLFEPFPLPDAVIVPEKWLPASDVVTALVAPQPVSDAAIVTPEDPNPYQRGAAESEDAFARRLSDELTRSFTLGTTDRDAAARGQAQILEAIRTGAPEIVADYGAFIQRLDPDFFHDPQGRFAALSTADPALAAAGPLKPLPDASVGFLVPDDKSRLQAWIEDGAGLPALLRPEMAADGQLYNNLDNIPLNTAIHRPPPLLFELYRRSEAALARHATENQIRSGDPQAIADLLLGTLPFGFGLGGGAKPGALGRIPKLPQESVPRRQDEVPLPIREIEPQSPGSGKGMAGELDPDIPKTAANPPEVPPAEQLGRPPPADASSTPLSTRFVDGIVVIDQRTGQVYTGTVDLQPTLDRIDAGIRFPSRNDGSVFQNRPTGGGGTSLLPVQPLGYYTEYVVPTPGIKGPGPQRIIVGKGGETYYTPDHYNTSTPVR